VPQALVAVIPAGEQAVPIAAGAGVGPAQVVGFV